MQPRPRCKSNESCAFFTGNDLPPGIRVDLHVNHLLLGALVMIRLLIHLLLPPLRMRMQMVTVLIRQVVVRWRALFYVECVGGVRRSTLFTSLKSN